MKPDASHTAAVMRRRFLFITIFLFAFSVIYEHFGHGAWSPYMIYCWCGPFVLGVLPMHLFARRPQLMPGRISRYCLYSCAATVAVGCVMRGVLDIYGTTSRLCSVYMYAAIVLLATAAAAWLIGLMFGKRKEIDA